ncbi:MAG: cytochrome P450 [Mycobacterium sp.]
MPTTATFPHPPWRLPIVGDLLTTNLITPCQGLAKDLVAHGGTVEQRLFSWPVLVTSRVDLINDVNDETVWEKHVAPSLRKLRPVAGDGLFTAYNHEPNWSKAHNILTPAFTKTAMSGYHASMLATVEELISAWSAAADHNQWIDIPSEANRLTTEIVARAGIGHSFNQLGDTTEDPFIVTVQRELTYANRRTDAIPFYDKLFRQGDRAQHHTDKAALRAQVAELIDARRAAPSAAGADMLDIMLTSTDPDSGERLDDANIINQILTLLVAGSETSANAIAFALHYLAQNPALAGAAREELDQRWPTRDVPVIAFDDVAKLRYLRRIVDETLRLWPIAPGYFRQAKSDTTIGPERYPFKAGDWIFVLLLAAHRDPATWGPDAGEFDPDRFLTERIRELPAHVYKPFGTGARACIGRQFAIHEIMLSLAAILHQFDLEPERGYALKVSETLTLKPEALRLRLRRRH